VDLAFKKIVKSAITEKSLNEQTSATYNIVQDLEGGKYAPAVAKVGLGQWVAELKARNLAFAELMRDRVDEGSSARPNEQRRAFRSY